MFSALLVWALIWAVPYAAGLFVLYIAFSKATAKPTAQVLTGQVVTAQVPAAKTSLQTKATQPTLTATVLLPVRNEMPHLQDLLHDLAQQQYAPHLWEVWVLDDGSTDQTAQAVKAMQLHFPAPLHYLAVPQNARQQLSPKKRALTLGVQQAKGSIILTTDGDCRLGPQWLPTMLQHFNSTTSQPIHMVSGPVRLEPQPQQLRPQPPKQPSPAPRKRLWHRLQAIEFASLIATGAATLQMGQPSMANAANLAYRKKAFEQVGGYTGNEQVASGDDAFLLKALAQQYPGSIAFANHPAAIVSSQPQPTWQLFKQQRLRWAGKWRFGSKGADRWLGALVLAYHAGMLLLTAAIAGAAGWGSIAPLQALWLLAIAWGLKAAAEAPLLRRATRFLQQPMHWLPFTILVLVYPLYAVFFALASWRNHFEWKGRQFKATQNTHAL